MKFFFELKKINKDKNTTKTKRPDKKYLFSTLKFVWSFFFFLILKLFKMVHILFFFPCSSILTHLSK